MPFSVIMRKTILLKVEDEGLRRHAEQRDAAAHHQMIDHLVERRGRAAHFEADVEAFLHAEPVHHLAEVLRLDVDRHDVGDLGGERQPLRVHVGDDDMARADMAGDGGAP